MSSSPDSAPYPIDHLAELASARGMGEAPALVLRDEVLNHDELRQRVDRRRVVGTRNTANRRKGSELGGEGRTNLLAAAGGGSCRAGACADQSLA